jgi:hypothetical protein
MTRRLTLGGDDEEMDEGGCEWVLAVTPELGKQIKRLGQVVARKSHDL